MKITKKAFATLAGPTALALVAVFVPTNTYAVSSEGGIQDGINAAKPSGEVATDLDDVFTTVVNILLFVIGAISVVMLIFGGIRYTLSAGDSGAVTAAKNTILYAIVGLIIAFLAFAIVNWVLTEISK